MVIESNIPEIQARPTEAIKETEPVVDDSDVIIDIVQKIEGKNIDDLDHMNGDDSTMYHHKTPDYSDVKLQKRSVRSKKFFQNDSLSNSPTRSTSERGQPDTPGKNFEDTLVQISHVSNNKLIDQDVLKNVVNFFFKDTYKNVTERMKNHLKPEFTNRVIEEIDNKYKLE